MKTQDGYDWPTPHDQAPEMRAEDESAPRMTAGEVMEERWVFRSDVPMLPLSDREAVRLLRP